MNDMVSVIVPVYNAKSYIIRTIENVIGQTCSDWELILIDDCSTDGSAEVIEEYLRRLTGATSQEGEAEADFLETDAVYHEDNLIRLIRLKQNAGAAGARNMGIRLAEGRYIAFLDADDIWMTEKLEKELAFMQEKQAAFVFTAYEFGDEQANGTGKIVHVPPTLSYREALSRTVIFTTTVLFDMWKLDRQLVSMPEVKSEDTATWWKILRTGITAYGLDEVLAVYRRPPKSLSSNKGKAMLRIWNLYRRQEKLGLITSCIYFIQWALRATLRRI